MDLINLIKESRFEFGKGSAAGRSAISSLGKKAHTKSSRSRVKVYKSIMDALSKGYVGQMFTTKESDRLYVITVRKWGEDPEQTVGGRSAKAFYGFKDAKRYAVRTLRRHGKRKEKKFGSEQYWKKAPPKD